MEILKDLDKCEERLRSDAGIPVSTFGEESYPNDFHSGNAVASTLDLCDWTPIFRPCNALPESLADEEGEHAEHEQEKLPAALKGSKAKPKRVKDITPIMPLIAGGVQNNDFINQLDQRAKSIMKRNPNMALSKAHGYSEKEAISEGSSLFKGNEKLKIEWAAKVKVDEKNLLEEKALLLSSMENTYSEFRLSIVPDCDVSDQTPSSVII